VITQPPFDHLLIVAGFLLNPSGEFLHIALSFCKIVIGHFYAAPNPPHQVVLKPDGFITALA
jgi:hypothetical protein